MIIDRFASHASDTNLSRRNFLVGSVAAGGGLVLSFSLPIGRSVAAASEEFASNAFIRIGSDGQIVLTMPYVEMGQGTYTSVPMLIAGNPRPSDADIDDAMSGNICRCGTYVRIREAIKQAAQGG